MSSLSDLVVLAKCDPDAAEAQLLVVIQDIFPQLNITRLAVNRGSKIALNSVNGIITDKDGARLFFKFHAEEGEQKSLIEGEYYRAELLGNLGWNVIKPLAVSTKPGRQCLIYPEITAPMAYDVFGQQDDLYLRTQRYDEATRSALLKAEENYLKKATATMLQTLEPASPETASATLFQLFSHRLNSMGGATPRVDLFYTAHPVTMPDGSTIPFEEIAAKTWVINGVEYPATLADIIALSKKHLAVENLIKGPTVISHGDDHNGNKFFVDGEFITFDPAFAGRHPALIAPIKGTAHNGPLHPFWYYEPEKVHDLLKPKFVVAGNRIKVTHNGAEVLASPLREEMVALHVDLAWKPLLAHLKAQDMLPDDWQTIIKCAAFCCPFLAVNMINAERLATHPQLTLFNLSKCVQVFHIPELDFKAE